MKQTHLLLLVYGAIILVLSGCSAWLPDGQYVNHHYVPRQQDIRIALKNTDDKLPFTYCLWSSRWTYHSVKRMVYPNGVETRIMPVGRYWISVARGTENFRIGKIAVFPEGNFSVDGKKVDQIFDLPALYKEFGGDKKNKYYGLGRE